MSGYLFTSESVAAGHPDKICDNISDAILDAFLTETLRQGLTVEDVRCACETLVKTGLAMVAGEVRVEPAVKAAVDVEQIVRETIRDIGYDQPGRGFEATDSNVINALGTQSENIAQAVDKDKNEGKTGAGDQGLMFGYACRETSELMPLPIQIAHELMREHGQVRRKLPWLGPDAKAQVTVRYVDDKPAEVKRIVLSAQHDEKIEGSELHAEILKKIIAPVLARLNQKMPRGEHIFINPGGRFVTGGPKGDCGLTGRKIIVDTYGGAAPHGGGAFSGKDPTKVDRSAAYMMRYVAKNIVAAGLADKCLVQVAYAIGKVDPVSIRVKTCGADKKHDEKLTELVEGKFDLTPDGIMQKLDLWRPIYRQTAAYGHFGRCEFPWEQTDMVGELAG